MCRSVVGLIFIKRPLAGGYWPVLRGPARDREFVFDHRAWIAVAACGLPPPDKTKGKGTIVEVIVTSSSAGSFSTSLHASLVRFVPTHAG